MGDAFTIHQDTEKHTKACIWTISYELLYRWINVTFTWATFSDATSSKSGQCVGTERPGPHINVIPSPSSRRCAVPYDVLAEGKPEWNSLRNGRGLPAPSKTGGTPLTLYRMARTFRSRLASRSVESRKYDTLSAIVKEDAQASKHFVREFSSEATVNWRTQLLLLLQPRLVCRLSKRDVLSLRLAFLKLLGSGNPCSMGVYTITVGYVCSV